MSQLTHTASATSPMKVASASLIGTTVEYYDFFIYGTAAALVFPKLFFPEHQPAHRRAALLRHPRRGVPRPTRRRRRVRPLRRPRRPQEDARHLPGHHGCRHRLMGLMPSYAVIGIAAPILLTLLRLVQGFAVGGEWGGATLMAVEHAPPGRRGFFGAFPQMGAPAGVGLATIAFFLVSQLDPRRRSWPGAGGSRSCSAPSSCWSAW